MLGNAVPATLHASDEGGVSEVTDFSVRLTGTLPDAVSAHAPWLQLVGMPETILRGRVRDDAALHGLLQRLQSLNVTVLEVRRLPFPHAPVGSQPAGVGTSAGYLRVEAVVQGAVGELGRAFIGEILSSQTVQTQFTVRSALSAAEVATRLSAAGADVTAIWAVSCDADQGFVRPARDITQS